MTPPIEKILLTEVEGPVAAILACMPWDRRDEINLETPEEAKKQMDTLVSAYRDKKESLENSGMLPLEAHQVAIMEILGGNP
ncbi:MAG: hypothetical protein AABY93_08980 [Bacteroidota bacterium]